jgi:two-component system chemotaxis response regulator CheB
MSAEGYFGPGEQSLVDMIQMWGINKTTGILSVINGVSEGEVHFCDGKSVGAKFGDFLADEEAIYHMLSLEEGKFRFVNTRNINKSGGWSASYHDIIMEGMRRLDHLNSDKREVEDKLGLIPFIVQDISKMDLSEHERVFLGLMDNKRNLDKVFNSSGLGLQKGLEIFRKMLSDEVFKLRKVRVLVVDDQDMWRKVISKMLLKEPFFEIAGVAEDGLDALKKLSDLKPDVMTLDLEMPRLDGIKTLYWMMSGGYDILLKSHFNIKVEDTYRCPVVVISAIASKMAPETLEALMGGASGYITKPSQVGTDSLEKQQQRIAKTVLMASQVDLAKARRIKPKDRAGKSTLPEEETRKLVCVASSTVGGLTSLMQFIPALPKTLDAAVFVVVDDFDSVGHAASFAEFLDRHSDLGVFPAAQNTIIKKGAVYIMSGTQRVVFGQTRTKKTGFKVESLNGQKKGFRVIDDMLLSAARCRGLYKRTGVVLAGDGVDGKLGFLEMVKFGEKVFTQDSYSSLNPVKPENVASTGISRTVPLAGMAKRVVEDIGKRET